MLKKSNLSVYLLLLTATTNGIRVAPKLDFEKSDTETRSGFRSESNYGGVTNLDNIRVACTSNNCETVKTSGGGVSTDVLVHVKTDTKISNQTTVVQPDVPIIIGNKSNKSNSPTTNPSINFLTPLSPNNPFILSGRSNFLPNTQLRGDSQIKGLYEYNNYAPGFPGTENELQRVYPQSGLGDIPIIQPQTGLGNNIPIANPNQRTRGFGSYNPVEFRKTYQNTWSPTKWYGGNTDRRLRNNIPRWTPCVCDGPQGQYSSNLRRSPRPYVNDKLGSLN